MKILRTGFILIVLSMISTGLSAKVVLPNLLTNNAVLQRNSMHKLWGEATPNSEVKINASWSSETVTTTADEDGNWLTYIETPDAGGPYTITFDDGEITRRNNILIGEVWFLSGQSNMFMKLRGNPDHNIHFLNAEEIIANADNDNLRLYTVLISTLSRTPIDSIKGSWRESNPANAENFSAVGFQFGQMLQEALGIPVGIVVSAWGGSPAKAWIGEEYLKEFPEMMIDPNDPPTGGSPLVLYNSMVYPLRNYSFRGALWYQGSGDIYNYMIYEKMMQRMAQNWRETFDVTPEEFPFYIAQNHPYFWNGDATNRSAAFLREAQLKASFSIPNSGYIVTLDVGEEHDNHPPDKTTVARRYTNLVLAKNYGVEDVIYKYPEYVEKRIEGNKIILKFKNVEDGIKPNPDLYKGFEVAGEDKMYYPATSASVINKDEIEIFSENVPVPFAVRYAFTNYSDAYIFNSNDMPAASFRTDELLTATGEDVDGVISLWNFNSDDLNPSVGTGVLRLVGGLESGRYSGGTNPRVATVHGADAISSGGNRSLYARPYPRQGENPKTAGVEIAVNTEGYKNIKVSADIRHNSRSANTIVLQYSTDGTNWLDAHKYDRVTLPEKWFLRYFNFSEIEDVNDNPNAKFRFVTDFDDGEYRPVDQNEDYAYGNDIRFDNIVVLGDKIETSSSSRNPSVNSYIKIAGNRVFLDRTQGVNTMNLYNMSGNLIRQYEYSEVIELNLPKGIYIIRYGNSRQKLVIN